MENTKQIALLISNTNNSINELENEIVNASYKERRTDAAIIEKCQTLQELKIAVKILKDNYRIAFVNESMPIIQSVISKYIGKKYGEKTKDKIRDELRGYGISFWIESYSSLGDDMHIAPLTNGYCHGNDYIIIKYPHNVHFTDTDNKIQALPEDLKFSHSTYVENPMERAKSILAAFDDMKEKYHVFAAAMSEYNSLLPNGIDSAYVNGFKEYLNI